MALPLPSLPGAAATRPGRQGTMPPRITGSASAAIAVLGIGSVSSSAVSAARPGAHAQCRKQRKLDVSNRLKEVRKACGLRQQDVAEKTGINVITLSGYELARSEPNMEALVRLADVYHVTLDYLMCRTDTKE